MSLEMLLQTRRIHDERLLSRGLDRNHRSRAFLIADLRYSAARIIIDLFSLSLSVPPSPPPRFARLMMRVYFFARERSENYPRSQRRVITHFVTLPDNKLPVSRIPSWYPGAGTPPRDLNDRSGRLLQGPYALLTPC